MLISLVTYILAFLIFYLAGNLLLSFFQTSAKLNQILIFLRLVTGLFSVVSMYAIFKTGGNTIQLIFPIMFVAVVVYSLFQNKLTTKGYWQRFFLIEWESLIFFSILSAVFIILFQYRFIGFDNMKVLTSPDLYYYGSAADYMNKFGIESNSFEIIDVKNTSPSLDNLYHYFELWFAALLSKLSGTTGVNALMKVCFPFLYSLIGLGCLKVINYSSKLKLISRFSIAVLIFFLTPISSYLEAFSGKIFSIGFSSNLSLMSEFGEKLSVPTLFLILSLVLYKFCGIKRLFLTITPLLVLSVIYPTTLPGLMGTIGVGIIWFLIFKRKKIESVMKKEILYVLYAVIVTMLFFFAFFLLNEKSEKNPDSINSMQMTIAYILKPENLILLLKNFIANYIKYIIIELPYILLFLTSRKSYKQFSQAEKWTLISLFVVFSFSSFISFVLAANPNAYQFLENLMLSILFVIHFLILFKAFQQQKWISIIAFFVVLVSLFGNDAFKGYTKKDYRPEFVSEIKQEIGSEDYLFAYRKDTIYNSRYEKSAYYKPLFFINTFNPFYFPFDLGALDKKFDNIQDSIDAFNSSMFSPYAKFVKKHGYLNNDSARSLFIKENKINYLIWHKNLSIPEGLNIEKIIADENVDYRVIKLNN